MAKVPKWVKKLPYSLDKTLLEQIAKSSKNSLEDVREMNFVVFGFESKEHCEQAIYYFNQKGWHSQISKQKNGKFEVTATKDNYTIAELTYFEDCLFFERIAKLVGAKLDGCFASN
ncbi:MAG: hypothetical protein Q7T41_01710 [Candidatus Saccharibacteria bacterium]|nr:hypothetical protein [Candidatus Saccharibacteria bacterium]